MPPVLLLKNDKDFYGTFKPKGKGDVGKLERPAPPPNPMNPSIALTTNESRENFKERVTENINAFDTREKPVSTDELRETNIKKLQNENDSVMNRVVKFVNDPMGINDDKSVKPDTEMRLNKREIVGGTNLDGLRQVRNDLIDKPLEAAEDTIKEVSVNISNFVNDKLLMAVVIVGGIYIAGQFAGGLGKSVSSGKKVKVEE